MNPTTTIAPGEGWMLQTSSTSTSNQRAQALDSGGNEHAFAIYGARKTETAEFTFGGEYAGNMAVPDLGGGITEYTLTYSETEFPKLSVSKDEAAGGGTFKLPFTLPARTLGVPSVIPSVYTAIGNVPVKDLSIAVKCQHFEEMDGNGEYGTFNGMCDVTVTLTFNGIDGKPSPTMAEGWSIDSEATNAANTGLNGGSVVYSKHFAVSAA